MRKKKIEEEFSTIPCIYDAVIEEEIMVPMSDGAGMKTYIYRPDTPEPVPVLIQRGCYINELAMIPVYGRAFAQRGFGSVFQFCRGSGGSEGEWVPNVNERSDGMDCLNWLNDQPWVESIDVYKRQMT